MVSNHSSVFIRFRGAQLGTLCFGLKQRTCTPLANTQFFFTSPLKFTVLLGLIFWINDFLWLPRPLNSIIFFCIFSGSKGTDRFSGKQPFLFWIGKEDSFGRELRVVVRLCLRGYQNARTGVYVLNLSYCTLRAQILQAYRSIVVLPGMCACLCKGKRECVIHKD